MKSRKTRLLVVVLSTYFFLLGLKLLVNKTEKYTLGKWLLILKEYIVNVIGNYELGRYSKQ